MNAVIINDEFNLAVKVNVMVEDKSLMDASNLHEREVLLTPTLQHILEQSERGYQHWGLND